MLVSIITPMYNAEKYISATIESVQSQTYKNFEMIIVDDLSTDNSRYIVERHIEKDDRIKYYCLDKKQGAAGARNLATKKAKGSIIAFLDADDIWDDTKLMKMIKFMRRNNYCFIYSDYRFIDSNGADTGDFRIAPNTLNYSRLLYNSSSIGCLTAMYDVDCIGKIYVPLLKKRNDVAIWQKILKMGFIGHRYPEVLASHRKVPNSLSRRSGKLSLLKHHYTLYKVNLSLTSFEAIYYSLFNILFYFYTEIFRTKCTNVKMRSETDKNLVDEI